MHPSEYANGLDYKLRNPRQREVRQSLCCWSDLLGFAASFIESNWAPTDDVLERVYGRISRAHQLVYRTILGKEDFMLALNDGIARTCDAGAITHLDHLSMWLRACVLAHRDICNTEASAGLPGCRTVIAYGVRLVHGHPEITFDDLVYNYTKADPSGRSEIAQRLGNPVLALNPTALQLNLAFSRAYLLNEGGSKIGLSGAHLFIDQSVVEFIRSLATQLGSPHGVIWERRGDRRLFCLPARGDLSRFHVGFELAEPPVHISSAETMIKTTVWKVLAYYPWDEDVADFKFDLE
ncbi:MAG: hypothetical protein ACJ746_16465 [Bryobacteraceae bacterium]